MGRYNNLRGSFSEELNIKLTSVTQRQQETCVCSAPQQGITPKLYRTAYTTPKRPRKQRPYATRGLTVSDLAANTALWKTDSFWAGADRFPAPSPSAVRRLLIEHGWLITAPYGRDQARSLATEKTVNGGYGVNIDPSETFKRRPRRKSQSFPFPAFWPDRIKEVVASLQWPQIAEGVSSLPRKQERLAWLMRHHSYLPIATLSNLSGMSPASVKRFKAAQPTSTKGN
ncbi:MAG: hypothetical protein ABF739_11965 [Acetobacter okinawensis]|uniref:hypothetical protein n=1 Tax=Acetobacter okinawensis TaxID=1076594 RepID=UPI0039E9C12D